MILNGLRYLKYKNIIGITGTLLETLTPNKETKGEKYRGYAKSFITFGIIFNIVLYSFFSKGTTFNLKNGKNILYIQASLGTIKIKYRERIKWL